jgi:hypothetical protein
VSTTPSQPATMPAPEPMAPTPRAHATDGPRPQGRGARAMLAGVSAALGMVILAPVALSSQDLYGWGADPRGLGLRNPWPWFVFLGLDFAAAACIGMAIVSAWRRERAGVFAFLVWVFALTSAYAQYRHGLALRSAGKARDVYWALPTFALLGPVLLHAVLSRVRRWARQDVGELYQGAAGFGIRWAVAPRETLRAWAASRREGIATTAGAVAYVRERATLAGLAPVECVRYAFGELGSADPHRARVWLSARGVLVDSATLTDALAGQPVTPSRPPASRPATLPATAAAPAESPNGLANMSKADALRAAWAELGSFDVPAAARWLKERGITVDRSTAHKLARREAARVRQHAGLSVVGATQ